MAEELSYGARLTTDEYRARIIELHRGLPPLPSKEQDRQVRRQELDLAIDHRLGCDFPAERREALWAAKERVERRRLRLAVKLLWKKVFRQDIARDAQGVAGYVVDEYAKVLSKNELKHFFALGEGERPSLPMDVDNRQKPIK
jgi:hypothetical protein